MVKRIEVGGQRHAGTSARLRSPQALQHVRPKREMHTLKRQKENSQEEQVFRGDGSRASDHRSHVVQSHLL